MDWETLIQHQKELEVSFQALKQLFEQAEKDFKTKHLALKEGFATLQKQEAMSLAKIHDALQGIITMTSAPKQ